MSTGGSYLSPQGSSVVKSENLITIIISCCGLLEYTRQCLRTIVRNSRAPFDLVFLESSSLDGTTEYLTGFLDGWPARAEIIPVETEWTFKEERKEEIISIRGDYVAVLNNDVMVAPGWLSAAVAALEKNAHLGMVGTLTNLGPKNQTVPSLSCPTFRPAPSEAGPSLSAGWKNFLAAFTDFARGVQDKNKGALVETDQVGGGCALLKKACFRKLNAFPARTPLGHFDIEGLSQRIKHAGFGLAICAEVFVHSFGIRAKA